MSRCRDLPAKGATVSQSGLQSDGLMAKVLRVPARFSASNLPVLHPNSSTRADAEGP